MNPIDKILEAFDETFVADDAYNRSLKDFIRTAFASYTEELREKIEEMRKPRAFDSREDDRNYGFNAALDQVLDLLK